MNFACVLFLHFVFGFLYREYQYTGYKFVMTHVPRYREEFVGNVLEPCLGLALAQCGLFYLKKKDHSLCEKLRDFDTE